MATAGLQSNFAALTVPLNDHALAKSPPASRARNIRIGAYRWCEPVADSLAAAAAVQGVTFYAALRHSLRAPQSGAFGATMLAMILVLGLFKLTGSYRTSRSMLSVRETADAISVSCITAILLLLFSVADLIHLQPSQSISIAALLFPLLLLERYWTASLLLRWHERGIGVTTVAICGSGIACKRLYTTLVDSPKLGLWPAVVIDPSATAPGSEIHESGYRIRRSSPVLAEKPNCETLQRWGVERILLIASSFNSAEMQAIISQAGRCGLPVQICGSDLATSSTAWQCADADGAILWNPTGTQSPRPYEYLKRALDMFSAMALITALLPLLAAIAAAIKLTSPGDVIFRQVRVGRRNRRFTMFKFRSMHTGACGDRFSPTSKTDARITAIGRILRKTSLDELPQLFNVLRGEMSLVGPRPEMRFIVDGYTPLQARRLEVAPGITGLWQLSADRKDLIHHNVEYDLYYLTHRSLSFDAAILLHTLVFAMRGI
jgi:exopolysaccharide biosynthesis polyprenyl glycosylphosphotransferase